jgi:putative CocE/NonD family hydrolase
MKAKRIVAISMLGLAVLAGRVARVRADDSVDMGWGTRIPMRDGAKLQAILFKPSGPESPRPVIFTVTPYGADVDVKTALEFAKSGYVFALVDCRGRGNSEGRFEPFARDGQDGYDVVEWLAAQPWSNGRVGMWGGSYQGFTQWTTAKERPPHLASIMPVSSTYPGVDWPFTDNVFRTFSIMWLTYTSGVTPNEHLLDASSYWFEKFHSVYEKHLPFASLDRVVGNLSTPFQTWLQHPAPDAYWDRLGISPEEYGRIHLPILTITGAYDEDQRGALEFYQRHLQHASEEEKARSYLVIGPWDHSGTRKPRRDARGVQFGEASLIDMNELQRAWFDWTLRTAERPTFLKSHVAYYVAGADEWRYADRLEDISTVTRFFYLQSTGTASDVFHSGTLGPAPPTGAAVDRYVDDPVSDQPKDSSLEWDLKIRGNGLVYVSEPLTAEMEITGSLKFVAWIAMDVPDADFLARVWELLPNGTSVPLAEDMMRARYRESPRQEKAVRPGEINRYEFDTFSFFSRRLAKGSRLRLVLSAPNHTLLEKNYHSGGVVAQESGKDARTAHITLYHDREHPSHLELPIGSSSASR